MTKRRNDPGLVAVGEDQVLLFDVPAPPKPEGARRASVRCSECGRPLRAPRSIAAGVSQACAAKVGVAVLASVRGTRQGRVAAVAEAV
jgi:hypothetical protein